jgi:hypothetical protein
VNNLSKSKLDDRVSMFVGMDLHKNYLQIAVMNEKGKVLENCFSQIQARSEQPFRNVPPCNFGHNEKEIFAKTSTLSYSVPNPWVSPNFIVLLFS